jgi:hypothetical protein
MGPDELERFEAAAGPFLDELGYERAIDRPDASAIRDTARIRVAFEQLTRSAAAPPRVSPADKYTQLVD